MEATTEISKETKSMSATASATTTTTSNNNTNITEDDLKLKPEFVLSSTHPTLTPYVDPRSNRNNNNNDDNNKHEDENKKQSNHKQKENRHKKNKRELKKRSRENEDSFKVCKAVLMGKECPFGDNCKFNHNLKEVLNNREEDIKEIGSCPHFDRKGYCPFGLSCRAGSHHLNLATGQNISKSEEEIGKLSNMYKTKVMNVPSRQVVDQLRRKKYKFVCKRFNEKGEKKDREKDAKGNGEKEEIKKDLEGTATRSDTPNRNVEGSEDVTNDQQEVKNDTPSSNSRAPIDMSPLPKTRKIIDFSNKVYIAPLTTVGNLPFRRVMKKFGADITCGEMAVARNLLEGKQGEWALLKRHPDEDIFGVQIAAAHADVYTRISEVIENEGFDIDFLDMNLGCPIDVLCNQGCGAKLMLKENKLRDSLKGMLDVLNIPVTIKIRTGWDEKKPFAHKLVPKIQRWGNDGIAAVMLHGRSRLQRYSKLADWNYIQQVAEAQGNEIPKLPIIGNGDIFSYVDYEEKVLKHKDLCPTAMLGRGALIKPWLPIEIKERRHWDISASERLDFLKDFVRFGLEHWGSDQQGVNTTRRFLLEWLSFLYRYVPVGMLDVLPQSMNQRPPPFMCGRNDLETLMLSKNSKDWVRISEMLLGKAPEGFEFEPKHKANSYK